MNWDVAMNLTAATHILSHCERIKQEHALGERIPIPNLPAKALTVSTLRLRKGGDESHATFVSRLLWGFWGPGTMSATDYQAFAKFVGRTRSVSGVTFADAEEIPPCFVRRFAGQPLSLQVETDHAGAVSVHVEVRARPWKRGDSIPLTEECLRLVQARAALLSGDPAYQRFFDHRDAETKARWVSVIAGSIAPGRLAHLSVEDLSRVLPPMFASGNAKVREFATDALALRHRRERAPQCGDSRASEGAPDTGPAERRDRQR